MEAVTITETPIEQSQVRLDCADCGKSWVRHEFNVSRAKKIHQSEHDGTFNLQAQAYAHAAANWNWVTDPIIPQEVRNNLNNERVKTTWKRIRLFLSKLLRKA